MKWKWPINMINCLTSLATRETEIKTSLSSHLTPVMMVIIKKTKQINKKQILARMWETGTIFILLIGM